MYIEDLRASGRDRKRNFDDRRAAIDIELDYAIERINRERKE